MPTMTLANKIQKSLSKSEALRIQVEKNRIRQEEKEKMLWYNLPWQTVFDKIQTGDRIVRKYHDGSNTVCWIGSTVTDKWKSFDMFFAKIDLLVDDGRNSFCLVGDLQVNKNYPLEFDWVDPCIKY